MAFLFYVSRFRNIFLQFPVRLYRFFKHFMSLFKNVLSLDLQKIATWPVHFIFLLLDLLGVPELYELFSNAFKTKLRPLTEKEIRIAKTVYEESINYKMVWLDENAFIGPKQGKFAYVGFNTINSYGKMRNHILIHELMHIWQFQHLGSVYIAKALWAQYSKEKYNYGGLSRLLEVVKDKGDILIFNFEQQGDIIADYYLLINGQRPQWSDATYADQHIYEYFVNQIRLNQKKYYV